MDVFIPPLIRPFDPNEHQDLLAIPRCLINDKKYNIDLEPFDISKIMTQGTPTPVVCCIQETKDQIDSVMKGLKACQEDYDRIEKVFINSNNLIEGVKNWKDLCLDRIQTIDDEIKMINNSASGTSYTISILRTDLNALATKIHNIECKKDDKELCSQTQKELTDKIQALQMQFFDPKQPFDLKTRVGFNTAELTTLTERVSDLEGEVGRNWKNYTDHLEKSVTPGWVDEMMTKRDKNCTYLIANLQREFNDKINQLKESMSSTKYIPQDSFAKALERIKALEKKTDVIGYLETKINEFETKPGVKWWADMERRINEHLEPKISINEQRTNDIYEKIKEMEKTISYNDTVHSKLILELQRGFDLLRADYKVEMEELKKKVSIHDGNIKGLALSTTQPPPCPSHERKMKLYQDFITIIKGGNNYGWFCPNCEMMAFGSSNPPQIHVCPKPN